MHIKRVHIVFKTHLDVGYTDFPDRVLKKYFDYFIPTAIETAVNFRQKLESYRYVWTTGSWLIYEYLEKATPPQRKRVEKAINDGDIVWHALPFTFHSEVMDDSLFSFGLTISQELDRRFGKNTIAAKMTDVPGHSRAIVPLLFNAGVRFLHIGVNEISCPPDVPPIFLWKDKTNAELIVMYHRSYGDLMVIPGIDEAIYFAMTLDNVGPHSPQEVRDTFDRLRQQFPSAEVIASTMDGFAGKLIRTKPQLPIVTGELGDTWIHGIGSDPKLVSQFRQLCRLRNKWMSRETNKVKTKMIADFSRELLLIAEHTWGLDVKTYLDNTNYRNAAFNAVRRQYSYRQIAKSWAQKRSHVTKALKALTDSGLKSEAKQAINSLVPHLPSIHGFKRIHDTQQVLDCGIFAIGFDSQTGAIIHLKQKQTGRIWASRDNPLALFQYETFSQKDYDRFMEQYLISRNKTADWAIGDFSKPGIATAAKEHNIWMPRLSRLYSLNDKEHVRFMLELTPPKICSRQYGGPASLVLQIHLPSNEPAIYLNLQWFDKTPTRLPEAMWLSFVPKISNSTGWQLEKIGTVISPLEVVPCGNRKMHAVNSAKLLYSHKDALTIETLDAMLVAPGQPSLLDFNSRQPELKNGMHFNLHNNVWGTNFRMWYDENAKFRFVLRF